MKNLISIIISTLFFYFPSHAQTSQTIPFQATVMDSSANLVSNQNISVRITIHDSPSRTILYQETQSVNTNDQGQFTVTIGSGTVVSGTYPFSGTGWEGNPMYAQFEIDKTGGTNYARMVLRGCNATLQPNMNLRYCHN